jgi:hypothetical protein
VDHMTSTHDDGQAGLTQNLPSSGARWGRRMRTNHGPALTPLSRLERIRAILESALTATQKCIGIAIVTYADEQTGSVSMSATQAQRYASSKYPDTMYRAAAALEQSETVEVTRVSGLSNSYRVIEPKVMQGVEDAYYAHKKAKAEEQSHPGPSGVVGVHPPGETTLVQTGYPGQTTLVQAGWSEGYHPGKTTPVLTRARDLLNTTTNNNLDSHTDSAREGEEDLGGGVFVNCKTVRHRAFVISLESIAMQLGTAGMPRARAEELARAGSIAHAKQWAVEIDAGKPVGLVVPGHPANFIRGSILRQYGQLGVGGSARIGMTPLEAQAEAWLTSAQGKMAIQIYGGPEQAKKFWMGQRQQKGTSNA